MPKLRLQFHFTGFGVEGWRCGFWVHFWLFFRETQSPAQLWFEAFVSMKKPSFLQCPRKPLFCAFVPQVTEKWPKSHPKPLPKWSEMGSKINLFSNLPKKSFFGFYLGNNHIPTVLGRPFFTLFPVIFLQKRGLRTGTPTNRSKFVFFWPRCKIVQMWLTPSPPGMEN